MPRSLTGMRMQGRLLDKLKSADRVFTKEELCKTLRLDRASDLDALADKTRDECKKGGCPYPMNIWGVGYRMSDS